ncbi:sodium/glutamate symporter [Kushneria pakistanensis]|uniref:Sodium/glutamate symporter n=1 Tax=Kushneria pakistanensis TaxID=1508770 RepID=A0ABQ3FEM3_9GAMM|nr:sodium/glutamate symporter [Kushneria pakistanensis]GHC20689.1 sodium/glutamate symporter [Kushneria pakistanensis]
MTPGPITTLFIAIVVLVIGQQCVKRVRFLREFNIPVPVVGGLVATLVVTALRAFGIEITFFGGLQEPFMLLFFASVGLSANFGLIRAGGSRLLIFFALVVGLLVLQNIVGVGIATLFGLSPVMGLLGGSITMSGGHGTGAAWAEVFTNNYGVESAMALAMAAATFGLVFGSLIGGPTASFLIRRAKRKGLVMESDEQEDVADLTGKDERTDVGSMIRVLCCLFAGLVTGTALHGLLEDTPFSLPTFVWVLFSCVIIGNFLRISRLYHVNDDANNTVGNVALSVFLALALMNLKLWDLANLALPMLVILMVQVALVFFYTTQVTFRVMGGGYDAAVLVAGNCGFAMGATPTAIANMQAVTERFGPSRLAFIIVPVVGGFLIDIANALIIKGFLFFT